MFSYIAYGLRVQSQIPFSNLIDGCDSSFDAVVRLSAIRPPRRMDILAAGEDFCVTKSGIYRFWDDVGTVLVHNGCEIIIDPLPGVDESVLRSVVLGPGFALLLHQRGCLVLHASAAAINHQAVAFLGMPGQGKSTIAMALYAYGHEIVADDVTVVTAGTSMPLAISSYPQINVSPNTLIACSVDPDTLVRVEPTTDKRIVPVSERFVRGRVPLTNIYVLDQGTESVLEKLSSQEALAELIRHSYCARMLATAEMATHLSQCARLVNATRVFRARVHRSLEELPVIVRLIEESVKADKR